MWLRSAFYRWLFPAAVVLPLWLLIGWVVTGAGGWALLWVLFIAVPSVFVGQIVLTLLQRARPSARETRMASWWDVLGFGVWHVLTIAIGFYPQTWFPLLLAGAIAAAIGLFWLQLWQLWGEARTAGGGIRFMRTPMVDAESGPSRATPVVDDVFVIKEKPTSEH